jgi:hypothetical protein
MFSFPAPPDPYPGPDECQEFQRYLDWEFDVFQIKMLWETLMWVVVLTFIILVTARFWKREGFRRAIIRIAEADEEERRVLFLRYGVVFRGEKAVTEGEV